MKTKFKKNGRRLLAAVLCLVMAVMALPMSAFAWTSEEGVSCTSSFGDYYVGSDGGYYRSKSSYSFIVYDSDGNTSVRTISAGNAKRKYLMTDSSGTHQVYCVESGIDFNTGNSYVSQELLEYLKRENIPAALATSTNRKKAMGYLDMANVTEYFRASVCGDEVKAAKPAGDIFIAAAEALGVPTEKCLVLEDSPNGLKAAKNAGCKAIVIPDLSPAPEKDLS